MFNNYFDNTLNNASVIINLNLVIKNYNLYKDLLLSMCVITILYFSDIDKSNLSLLFNGKINDTPFNFI